MANAKNKEMRLPSVDELFSSQLDREEEATGRIIIIPIEEIDPFPDHPYKVRDDQDMMNLAESIKTCGVLTPVTVRRKENGRYELLSGHRRKRACELAGITSLRCEVVEMDRDQSILFMVDSNLQRTTILPSEKAFAYKMKLEVMKRQGKRTDLTSVPLAQKLKTSREILSEQVGESQDQVRRYIRLTELIPGILDMVDEGRISMRPAVEISYLPAPIQEALFECMEKEACTPSHDQTIRMRKLHNGGRLTPEAMEAIMAEEKPNQRDKIVIRGDRIWSLLPPGLPVSKREDYVVMALEHYARVREREKDRSER